MKANTSLSVKKILLVLLALLVATTSYAQEIEDYLPQWKEQISPSPTSQAYARYPGYKPDMSTGAMSLSIPLYTATEGELSIPLTLNYYSNGVKVMDNSFPLGYGWTLNPGLRITRTVMGKADETCTFEVRSRDFTYKYLWSLYDKNSLQDAAYDIFTIHLPNHNSTFLLKKENGEWKVLMGNSPLKITPLFSTYHELEGFSVVDEKGITYTFGGTYIERDIETRYSTAWMLYRVTLPDNAGTSVEISWSKHAATCNAERIYNDYCLLRDHYVESQTEPGMPGPGYEEYQGSLNYDYEIQNIFLPKQISMPGQTVRFTYIEYAGRPFLSDIVVKNALGTEVKTCGMDYSNQETLSGLYVSGEGSYKFDYYGGDCMDTRSQDLWGYYNGKKNLTLVPSFRMGINSFSPRLYEYKGADRSPDATAMQNLMLKKVTYPTRGYMQVEYEPHRFKKHPFFDILLNGSYESYLTEGGGVRVKKTVSCAGDGAPEVVRTYKYGTGENGEGKIVDAPEFRWFVNEQYYYHCDGTVFLYDLAFRQVVVGGVASTITTFTNNPNVWYPAVTEYEGENKITSYFECINNTSQMLYLGGTADTPYYPSYPPFFIVNYCNLAQKGALVKKQIIFKKVGNEYIPLEKNEYKYKSHGPVEYSQIENVTSRRFYAAADLDNGDISLSNPHATPSAFWMGCYLIDLSEYGISHEKKTLYQGGDSIVTEKVLESRDQDDRFYLTHSISMTDSQGDTYTDYLYYPCDSEISSLLTSGQRTAVGALKEKNRIAVPLVRIRKKGDKELFRKVVQYKNFGNNLLMPEKEYYSQDGKAVEERISYRNYDAKGNLLEVVRDGTIKTVYLWGYSSLYPVAKIEGATYTEVVNWLTSSVINRLASNWSPESDLQSIRNVLAGKNVQVTTYLYKPLVGITSITVPNGGKTTYEYDDSGRLIKVRNHAGQIVEQYDYQYKQ